MNPASGENVETVAQRARERIAEAANRHAFTPRDAERIVFEATGYAEVATEVTHAARRIGEDAKRSAKSELKRRYGGRAPGQGWIGWLLVLAAICAALSAAMSSGFRAAPEDREVAAVALATAAGIINAVTLVGMRLRPLDRVVWRIQAVVVAALALAATFTLSRGAISAGTAISVSGIVAVAMLVVMLAVRAARPDDAAEIDGSTARAYLGAIDEALATAAALQAQVSSKLGDEVARFVRQVRTAAFAGVPAANRARVDLSVYDSVPAGGVIIGDYANPKNWLPRDLASKAGQLEDPTRRGAS